MSKKELERSEIFAKLNDKRLKQYEAANILGITLRQVERLFAVYKKTGAVALISKVF